MVWTRRQPAHAGSFQDDGGRTRGRRNVPRHQLRTAARPRSPLHAIDAADGPNARLHVLSACRHDPHRGTIQRRARQGFAEPAKDFVCTPTRCRRMKPPARGEIVTNLATRAYRRPADAGGRQRADGVLQSGREEGASTTGSRWCCRASSHRRSSSIESKKSRRPSRRVRPTVSAMSTSRRACRSSCGARVPDDELLKVAGRVDSRIRWCSSSRSAGC